MTNYQISSADISALERALTHVTRHLDTIHDRVDLIAEEQEQVSGKIGSIVERLEALAEAFATFYKEDKAQNNKQFAQTRIIELRQEIAHRFSYYDEVRRSATGILQAVDTGLVTNESIKSVTEEMMIKARGYWLAPCLIGLSAWLSDNRPMAERAMKEALRRDALKTPLFFALVTRRIGRRDAVAAWLRKYLLLHNPLELERETVILLNGITNGVFGPEARVMVGEVVSIWLKDISSMQGFVENQKMMWTQAILDKKPLPDGKDYSLLRTNSPTWDNLEKSLLEARLHQKIITYFHGIFDAEISVSPSLLTEIDSILDNLVQNFDNEELPLRDELLKQQMLVEAHGDEDVAEKRFKSRTAILRPKSSFPELLANSAMHPELSNASITTQRFAIAMSKEWIISAYESLTERMRAGVPHDIELKLDDWSGKSRDGKNEAELAAALMKWLDEKETQELQLILWPTGIWVAAIISPLLFFVSRTVGLIAVVAAGIYISWTVLNRIRERATVSSRYVEIKNKGINTLRVLMTEIVALRSEIAHEDAKADVVQDLVRHISSAEFTIAR